MVKKAIKIVKVKTGPRLAEAIIIKNEPMRAQLAAIISNGLRSKSFHVASNLQPENTSKKTAMLPIIMGLKLAKYGLLLVVNTKTLMPPTMADKYRPQKSAFLLNPK